MHVKFFFFFFLISNFICWRFSLSNHKHCNPFEDLRPICCDCDRSSKISENKIISLKNFWMHQTTIFVFHQRTSKIYFRCICKIAWTITNYICKKKPASAAFCQCRKSIISSQNDASVWNIFLINETKVLYRRHRHTQTGIWARILCR